MEIFNTSKIRGPSEALIYADWLEEIQGVDTSFFRLVIQLRLQPPTPKKTPKSLKDGYGYGDGNGYGYGDGYGDGDDY